MKYIHIYKAFKFCMRIQIQDNY